MQKRFFLFLIIISCLSLACSQKASDNNVKSHKIETQPKEVMNEKITLEGKFESKKGVMTQLSCFCYNCGYLITGSGQRVAVCFPKDEEEISCTTISLTGEYVTETKSSDPNGVCSGGTITYLKVSSFECIGK
jgi:hypothetical protein